MDVRESVRRVEKHIKYRGAPITDKCTEILFMNITELTKKKNKSTTKSGARKTQNIRLFMIEIGNTVTQKGIGHNAGQILQRGVQGLLEHRESLLSLNGAC